MDFATIIGLVAGAGFILFGQYLEGGHASSVIAGPAALIVFGGTFGCVMVGIPMSDFFAAINSMKYVFGGGTKAKPRELISLITEMAKTARRDGLLALDGMVAELDNPFMKTAVRHVVDGVDSTVLREILEAEIGHKEEDMGIAAKVWEAAGGYAPTVGIIGAVLGLIHTMENLDDPSKIGGGIATAFVATVYGVAGANMLFLPVANKLKRKGAMAAQMDELVMEGVLAVQAGHNSHVIQARLEVYAGHDKKGHGEGDAEAAA